MIKKNPFEDSIFAPSRDQKRLDGYDLYPNQLKRLTEEITSKNLNGDHNNQIVMVSSPEAGHGKTHLISKAIRNASAENRILEIKITELEDFNYNDILKVALKSLYKKEPIGNRVKELFGVLIGDLIQNGIVPVANKSTAKKALQNHYLNMLDTNDDNSLIAKWFKGNFDALYPHLVQSLHKLFNISEKSGNFWIQTLFNCELIGLDQAIENLTDYTDDEAHLLLKEYKNLFSNDQRLIFLIDNIDNIFDDKQKCIKIAKLLIKLSDSDFSSTTIFSVNDDLWESSFRDFIPSALKDRINESNLRLDGLDLETAKKFLIDRILCSNHDKETVNGILKAINLENLFTVPHKETRPSARYLLRLASQQWNNMEVQRTQLNVSKARDNNIILDESTDTVTSIKEMMKEVNERAKVKAKNKTSFSLPQELKPPFKEIEATAPESVKDFAEHRNELYASHQSLFDVEALKYTLKVAGKRSPIIKYNELKIDNGLEASSWLSNETEFIFGFEPPSKTKYWIELIKESQNSKAKESKIIAFSNQESDKFESNDFDEIIQDKINVIQLRREDLASLSASNTIIQESDDEGKIFSQIAPELDAIWKKITKSA